MDTGSRPRTTTWDYTLRPNMERLCLLVNNPQCQKIIDFFVQKEDRAIQGDMLVAFVAPFGRIGCVVLLELELVIAIVLRLFIPLLLLTDLGLGVLLTFNLVVCLWLELDLTADLFDDDAKTAIKIMIMTTTTRMMPIVTADDIAVAVVDVVDVVVTVDEDVLVPVD